jgi:hypothetical protein
MAEDLGKSTLRDADLRDESRKRLRVLYLTHNAGNLLRQYISPRSVEVKMKIISSS